MLFTEPAGSTATSYNDSVTLVKYGELAYTQVRRFIVVRQKKAFCFAMYVQLLYRLTSPQTNIIRPIFTYHDQGTLKPGVEPDEHAIAYSWGQHPQLLAGETQLTKEPICIAMTDDRKPLNIASRIFFGIHHPIQYNVKVKDLGYVIPDHLSTLVGYWAMENQDPTKQDPETIDGGDGG